MFIHRLHITGSSDRGAWLWRPLAARSARAWLVPLVEWTAASLAARWSHRALGL